MSIRDKIESAVEWRDTTDSEGQTPWESKNSAAGKTTTTRWELISSLVREEVDLDYDDLPKIYEWTEHDIACVAKLTHVCQGSKVDRLLCTYVITQA